MLYSLYYSHRYKPYGINIQTLKKKKHDKLFHREQPLEYTFLTSRVCYPQKFFSTSMSVHASRANAEDDEGKKRRFTHIYIYIHKTDL